MRIMFAGPSGIGKTTLAKEVEKRFNIPFISGSMNDIMPNTKGMTHKEMMERDTETLVYQNWHVLNVRNKMFKDKFSFVTDRSFIDTAVYSWIELDTQIPECELEHLFGTTRKLMEQHCDLLIFCPLSLEKKDDWYIEDNGKRIQNRYFQVKVSNLMSELIAYMEIPTLVLNTLDFSRRMTIIEEYVSKWQEK